MSKIVRLQNVEQIQEQACNWVAKLDGGNLSETERGALTQWLNEDPCHGKVLIEMAELLDDMRILSDLSETIPLDTLSVSGAKTTERAGRRLRFSTAMAAVFLVSLVSLAFFKLQHWTQPTAPVFAANTDIGEYKTVTLPDNSRATLNTNSQINIDFSGAERNVFLSRGEAHFDVESDKSRPFRVLVGDKIVEAVGTAFNVKANQEDIEVTVTEGIVRIISARSSDTKNMIHAGDSHGEAKDVVASVSAGHVVVVAGEVESLDPIDQVSIEKKLAWQKGMIVFEGETLEDMVTEISRYTDTTFVITDDEARNIRVGGYFETGDIDKMLDILEYGFQIAAQKGDTGIIYLSRLDVADNHK